MRNISYFGKILKRGRLLEGDGLLSKRVDFEIDVGPDREPKQILKDFM